MDELSVGSLFSGIGGMELGLERAGMRTRWFCESNERCRRVLGKHWDGMPCYLDIRAIQGHEVERVDVLAGGFPCPVVSQAARGRNVAASLWPEFARLVHEIRPSYVVVENVEGLLSRGRGFGRVLGDLAEGGFDAVWRVLRASAFGAPHHRPRVWLVGYPHGDREPDLCVDDEVAGMSKLRDGQRSWSDPPGDLGMDDGISGRMDRCRMLGNSLLPQIAEFVGRRIIESREVG